MYVVRSSCERKKKSCEHFLIETTVVQLKYIQSDVCVLRKQITKSFGTRSVNLHNEAGLRVLVKHLCRVRGSVIYFICPCISDVY